MASTYTLNNGIELIGTGEQSGTWGATTNTNFDLVDTALDGQVSIALAAAGSSGSPNNLPVSDGTSSNGRNRMITFTDGTDLGATAYVQLTPNDSEKIIYVRNGLRGSRSILLFQGTYNASNDYEVPAGTTAVVYFNGAGTGAVAANVFNNAYFDSLRLGGVSVTAILDEDNMASDSATALSTQQSIKAYVDAQVGAFDSLAEVLAVGNTTGGTDLLVSTGDDITFADSSKAIFGAGSDLSIYHSGTHSFIEDNGTGNLYIDGAASVVIRGDTANTISAIFNDAGSVVLKHNGDTKLATTATGIDITGGFTATDGSKITTADNSIQLELVSTDADANSGAVLSLYRNSASPADGDDVGQIEFNAENSADEKILYADLLSELSDVTDGTEDGKLALRTITAGNMRRRLQINGTELVINEDSIDSDFRVESDSLTHALFVQGSNGFVGINNSSPATALDVTGTVTADGLIVDGTGLFSSASPNIRLDETDSTDLNTRLRGQAGSFRIETTADDASLVGTRLQINHTTGNVSIPSGNLDVTGTVTADGLTVQNGVADIRAGNVGPSSNAAINIGRVDSSISTNNPLGYVQFLGTDNTAGSLTAHAYIGAIASATHAAGSNPTDLVFGTTASGSETIVDRMRIDSSGNVDIADGALTVNTLTDNEVIGEFALWDSTQSAQPYVRLAHSLGTSVGSHTAITVSDALGRLTFAGSDGSAFYDGAAITADATQNFTGSVGGTRLEFQTTADGTRTLATKMTLDQDGHLGIGTTAPGFRLEVRDSIATVTSGSHAVAMFANENTGADANTFITLKTHQGDTVRERAVLGAGLEGTSGGYFNIWTRPNGSALTEKVRVTGDGNVRIGNTTTTITGLTQTNLVVGSGSGGEIVAYRDDNAIVATDFVGAFLFGNDDNNATEDHFAGMWAKSASTNGNMNIYWAAGSNNYEAGTPQMTLDTSGNLLVGQTTASDSAAGIYLAGDGRSTINRDGGFALQLNLLGTADGEILKFRKNGSTVGSIGVRAADNLYINSPHNGIEFTNSDMRPIDGNGDRTDDVSDIGDPDNRFKNLFLSGGVYLGGTVAANKLDDYEEGSWTVNMYDATTSGNESSTSVTGRYTKIGQQVICSFDAFNNVSTSGLTAGNGVYFTLPFTASSTGRSVGSVQTDLVTFPSSGTMVVTSVVDNASRASLNTSGSGTADTTVKVQDFNGTSSDVVSWTLSYRTAS